MSYTFITSILVAFNFNPIYPLPAVLRYVLKANNSHLHVANAHLKVNLKKLAERFSGINIKSVGGNKERYVDAKTRGEHTALPF